MLVDSLEEELRDLKLTSDGGGRQDAVPLNGLLADAIKSRDKYQADYLSAHRERSRLQHQVETYRRSVSFSS